MTAARPFADPGCDPAVVRFVLDAKEFCRLLESEAALPQCRSDAAEPGIKAVYYKRVATPSAYGRPPMKSWRKQSLSR